MGGLNAENAPDIAKCPHDWTLLGRCDDETDPKDGKGRRRLDQHRDDTGIHTRHLGGERLPCERLHPQEPEADHRGDDDIQAHAERDPRHGKAGGLSAQHGCVREGTFHYCDDCEH